MENKNQIYQNFGYVESIGKIRRISDLTGRTTTEPKTVEKVIFFVENNHRPFE